MLQKKYNLEERTAKFGEQVLLFCKTLKLDPIVSPLVNQLVRSSTSIGANYMEATGASSKEDFINKIFISKKESQETKHWIRMIAVCLPNKKDELSILWKEAQELTLIFQKIVISSRRKAIENSLHDNSLKIGN
jgi:four helix bundle protein